LEGLVSGFFLFGLDLDNALENGFVRQYFPEGFEPVELLHCAAVVAFRLDLIAHQQAPTVGLAGEAVESFPEEVVAVLGLGYQDVPVTGDG
jgi:hypothetical protein